MTTPNEVHFRYHAFDRLRAMAMLLGLVLHAAISFGTIPNGRSWRFKDAHTSPICDFIVFFIHVFRMPLFYVLAGFFAALIYFQRGPRELAVNRLRRILLPLALGWVVLTPLTLLGFTFAGSHQTGTFPDSWRAVCRSAADISCFDDTTIHLWFLYYLLLFYASVLIGGPILSRLPARLIHFGMRAFAYLLRCRWRPLVLALPTLACLAVTRLGVMQTSTSFVPDGRTFCTYFMFFTFGWLLYLRREDLATFREHAWLQVILATALAPIHVGAVRRVVDSLPDRDAGAHLVAAATGALMVWLLVFGISGLFLRYFNLPSRRVRYVVDASYWLYLVHLPLTVWLAGAFAHLERPALAKFLLVLAIMTPILFCSYNLFVRSTWIGVLLNGRRYPRGLPLLETRQTIPQAARTAPRAPKSA